MTELGNKRPIPSRAFNPVLEQTREFKRIAYTPWEPVYTAENNNLKVSVSPGTIGGILPDNWSEEFSVNEDETKYVKIKITSGEEGVDSATILLEDSEEVTNEYEKDKPPTNFTFILGIINGRNYSMTTNTHIFVSPVVAYYEEKDDAKAGEMPYTIYYGWGHH